MKEHLQPWYDKWLEEHRNGTKLIYANPSDPQLGQVHFVRDYLASVLWAGVPYDDRKPAYPRDGCKETALVIGEHHSKSVRLPVYLLDRPDLGIKFILRENFHDWNISVVSEKPITIDLGDLAACYAERDLKLFKTGFDPAHTWGYCFFQGFPEEFRFGPLSENDRRFSTYVSNNFQVYMLVWLIMRFLRGSK